MITVSVEDCLKKIPNRFDVIKLATSRAKKLSMGISESNLLSAQDHKNTVVALQEIAQGDLEAQEEKIID